MNQRHLLISLRLVLFFGWLFALQASAATLPFSFELDEDATTSAGIFKLDGTLVRTLWRKVEYDKGIHLQTWDGLTDEQTAAPAGSYAVRVLSHHLDYIWQGAIGNTSTATSGNTVHRGFRPLRDLTISGTDAFYTTGYVEGDYDFRHFLTTDIQRVNDRWCWYLDRSSDKIISKAGNIFNPEWMATDTDGEWVYFASPDSTNPTTREQHSGPGFVVASDVATHRSASFTNGAPIENGPANFPPFANGIKVGTTPGVAGLAVEKSGNLLAISNKPESKIYLVHKRTGAPLGTINLPLPGALAFAPNGDLWALSGNRLCKITNPGTSPVSSVIVPDLQEPLDVAVNSAGTVVAVVDAGSSQQVKAFSTTDNSLVWSFGQPGGYAVNGPVVTQDKFLFLDREGLPGGSIAFGPDGSFWLSDVGNRRLLHYTAERGYIEELMFQNVSYSSSVDANNPTRVFSDFQEFAVDYQKPLAQGWKLVKNWGANLSQDYFDFGCGIRQITTLSNGRTYGAVTKKGMQGSELVELTSQGLRFTGIRLEAINGSPGSFETLQPNGHVRRGQLFGGAGEIPPGALALFEEKRLTGFSNQNNPIWSAYTLLASAPVTEKDPATRCCSLGESRMPSTSTNILISFDATKNNGWHLGGVRPGGSDWLWKASPSVPSSVPLDGLGSFDIGDGVNYPGNSVFTAGRNVIFGYHGEFWADAQACQFMHFYDNGLFVGQFGESSRGHEPFEGVVPGRAGNSAFSFVTEVDGNVYLWANDESQYGPQRWLLQGTKTIRETTATGTLGQNTALALPVAPRPFPTNVRASAGDARVSLTWNPVAGGTGYNIKMTTTRGGISSLIAGQVEGAGKTINNLTNGQTYYFTVAAITPAGESVYSDPASVTPVSATKLVDIAGRYDQPGSEPEILQVQPNEVAIGKPTLQALSPLLGNLTRRKVGSAGYRIFKWRQGDLADAVNLPFGDTIESKTGWRNGTYLGYQFRVNNAVGSNNGLLVNEAGERKGLIEIAPHDSGIYLLTVVMPPTFRNSTDYKIRLTPKNQTTPSVGYDTKEIIGINHIYQFRFQGSVNLTVEAPADSAAVQAIFLDKVEVIPQATTGFQLWQQQNFTEEELANPAQSGWLADYDHDGTVNLLEYASGTAPKDTGSRARFLPGMVNYSGTDYLTFQFIKDRNARGIAYLVGVTSDLTDNQSWIWFDAGNYQFRVSNLVDVPAKGLETITVRDILPADFGPRFMRLAIIQ